MTVLSPMIKNLLLHPSARNLDVDDPAANAIVRKIIQEKIFLRRIYDAWYSELAGALPASPTGPVLELGSGAGFLKDYIPGLITSEILSLPHVHLVLDAHRLPFADGSLKAVAMVDVFHHLPRVRRFLNEAARCIKPGGVMAMIEPWHTGWSGWVYRHLHHEPFDPKTTDWHFPAGGPLSAANSALPWIVFERDRKIFEDRFPYWRLKTIRLHTPFAYLLSGGVAMRSLFPHRGFDLCRKIETALEPVMKSIAMFATIAIERLDFK